MAYFSNGSAMMDFEFRECSRCTHNPESEDQGCPVFGIHMLFADKQFEKGGERNEHGMTLQMLIDDSKPLGEMCQMRIGPDAPDPNQTTMFEEG